MAVRKTLRFVDDWKALVTIHSGIAQGEYPTNLYDLENLLPGGLLSLGHHAIQGKQVHLQIRFSELEGREEIPVRRDRHEAAQPPMTCDRCGLPIAGEPTYRPARVGGWKVKLPHCPTCARFLWESEDGFGETVGSVEPADRTPYHKGDDAGE